MQERRFARIFLIICSLFVLYVLFRIFQPFLLPVALAVILVSLTYPVFDWFLKRLKGRRNWAAFATCLAVTAVIIVPLVVFVIVLAGEIADVYRLVHQKLQRGDFDRFVSAQEDSYLRPILNWLNAYVDVSRFDLTGGLTDGVRSVSGLLFRYSTSILSGLFDMLTSFFIMVVSMFFFFRDGAEVMAQFASLAPLSEENKERIVNKFREVASATVLGSLLTAICQGLGAWPVYWLVGIPNSLFWGFLTALFSLVPLVGTALVWAPWALYLLSIGAPGRAALLVLLMVLFVGMIDNVLRPLFIEGRARMHTLLVFFSIMGGISYFGIIGMIFGPITVAIGLTFLELYKVEFQKELGTGSEA